MGTVIATAISSEHRFTKQAVPSINLLPGLGIEGDCHAGETVQHRSRLHIRPAPANLRQVHLIGRETLDQHDLVPGQIGENITTSGIDLLKLGKDTRLHFIQPNTDEGSALEQEHPIVTVTGLRNPCPQIEKHRKGLQEVFIERDSERKIVGRKAGIMSTINAGGVVMPGMRIVVEEPAVYEALGCV